MGLPAAVFTCDISLGSEQNIRTRRSELLSRVAQESLGIRWRGNHSSSHEQLLGAEQYPDEFTWCNKDGQNFCTMSRNQHNPSVQHILNCGNVGSCHGGSIDGVYQWLHEISEKGHGISYETAQPYMACSAESTEGFCKAAD